MYDASDRDLEGLIHIQIAGKSKQIIPRSFMSFISLDLCRGPLDGRSILTALLTLDVAFIHQCWAHLLLISIVHNGWRLCSGHHCLGTVETMGHPTSPRGIPNRICTPQKPWFSKGFTHSWDHTKQGLNSVESVYLSNMSNNVSNLSK